MLYNVLVGRTSFCVNELLIAKIVINFQKSMLLSYFFVKNNVLR